MKRSRRLCCLLIAAAAIWGCRVLKSPSEFEFENEPAVVSEGPPRPAGEAVDSSTEVLSDPQIQIDATTANGYEALPTELRELYGPSPVEVSLVDIINQTLSHNRDIQIEKYSYQIAETSVPIARSIYDLLITASGSASKVKQQTSSALSAATSRQRDYQFGLEQLLPTGASVQLTYNYNRINRIFFF